MSFASSSFWDALSVPSTKIPINIASFMSYIIPPVICYVVVAMLAVTPRTRIVRAALCPIVTLLAMRAVLSVDMTRGDPEGMFTNFDLVFLMMSITFHSLFWTLAKKPLVRHLRPANSFPSTITDALDLAINLRGYGWDWSCGLYVPRETRPTNRIAFAFYTFLSAIAHGLMYNVLEHTVWSFATSTRLTHQESTIFDHTLPSSARYFRASIISALSALVAYTGLQMAYHVFTVTAVLLLGQDPAQWPPVFDKPWCATSLIDFWGRRWHQLFRHKFVLGAYPFTVVFGHAGTIIGAFLSSAMLHHIMLILLDSRSEMWRMLVGFGMMGPGVLLEWTFYRSTGRKVCGVVGWVWTMTWLLLFGNVIIDGFRRAGMFSHPGVIGPMQVRVENLVAGFDAWLHTI